MTTSLQDRFAEGTLTLFSVGLFVVFQPIGRSFRAKPGLLVRRTVFQQTRSAIINNSYGNTYHQ